MVFCGKPSKGCQACRDRKTRCDKVTPSCTQCIRGQRVCPGYRSQLDLMFRNQSESVIVKAKAKEKEKAKVKSNSKSTSLTSTPTPDPSSSAPPRPKFAGKSLEMAFIEPDIVDLTRLQVWNDSAAFTNAVLPTKTTFRPIFPTTEERALGYFSTHSSAWLRNDIASDVRTKSYSEDHLLKSMAAVGTALFSMASQSPELMLKAQSDYGKALQLTNAALRSPTEVKKDSTLFAVMILSIYETVTGNNERSLAAWTEHINGAAALVKLRGPEQFKTEAGQRMYLQVTSNLMISCIQRTIPMPHHMIVLRAEAEKHMDLSSPAWVESAIIIDFTIFRAKANSTNPPPPEEIILAALEIEQRFIDMFDNLPESWRYGTVYTDENPDMVWNGMYHVYSEHWMAHIWNGMRTCRILLHEVLVRQLPLIDSLSPSAKARLPDLTNQLQKSKQVALKLRTDILASVPQTSSTPLHPNNHGNRTTAIEDGPRGYFVLWPLYLVAEMTLSTDEIRKWCIKRLRGIGWQLGIQQAVVLAAFLEERRDIEVWDRDRELEKVGKLAEEIAWISDAEEGTEMEV